jgi:hypothetical protein
MNIEKGDRIDRISDKRREDKVYRREREYPVPYRRLCVVLLVAPMRK